MLSNHKFIKICQFFLLFIIIFCFFHSNIFFSCLNFHLPLLFFLSFSLSHPSFLVFGLVVFKLKKKRRQNKIKKVCYLIQSIPSPPKTQREAFALLLYLQCRTVLRQLVQSDRHLFYQHLIEFDLSIKLFLVACFTQKRSFKMN